VKAPQALLRNALGLVLCGSAIVLLTKYHPPASILVPAFAVAAVVIGGLFAYQLRLHRQLEAEPHPSPQASY
jgi:hypothetical protein